jgi:hypothetical protein
MAAAHPAQGVEDGGLELWAILLIQQLSSVALLLQQPSRVAV